jgi:hypothetical protein
MAAGRESPVIYEINTWVWLFELTHREGRPVALGDVPEAEWDRLAQLGIDYVWLMGVWERSPASCAIARHHPDLQEEFDRALPDRGEEDVGGSPYAIRDYRVDPHLGGDAGLAAARLSLSRRGVGLILDFVPNHLARDHEWVLARPECLVARPAAEETPLGFFRAGDLDVAHGRDPYFPAWTDTAQLNAFSPAWRSAALELLSSIGERCDGVRCDMAMLLLNEVFERTWGDGAGPVPEGEFWAGTIRAVRGVHPDFIFLAEAYWGLEGRLLELGFDMAYDKSFYDRLRRSDNAALRQHLSATTLHHERMVKFIENHDEARAADAFGIASSRAAAVCAALMPGPLLLHEGQLAGRRSRVPVQMRRRREEVPDEALLRFYETLLTERLSNAFRGGRYLALGCRGWPDNNTCERLLAWLREEEDGERYLVVVNLADHSSQARIPLPWDDLAGRTFNLHDPFRQVTYRRAGDELRAPGLFVDLEPWGFHVMQVEEA